ncbi:MAG: glycosyltransferase [Bacteroidales bacterium]|nr:glycosyltransferase [Bacteroidales bacterium]
MISESKHFGEITLLITHYNRSLSLERLLKSFEELKISFHEIVVSDDGSKPEHISNLMLFKERYGITPVLTEKNKGLANNINKGQRAVKSPFTLYVQEDFTPTPVFSQRLSDGLSLIKGDEGVDLVRFYAYRKYPFLKPVMHGFSEMQFRFWMPDAYQFNCYSDHPHLRRSSFTEKFGEFKEGIKSDRAEFMMVIAFLQKKGRALIHNDYREIFIQENSAEEPSQVKRKKLRVQFQASENFLIKIIRSFYRNVKFRYEYLFLKTGSNE